MNGRMTLFLCWLSLAILGAVSAADEEIVGVSDPRARTVHADTAKVEQALVAATLAFLRERPLEARSALDVIHENSRVLHGDEVDRIGADLVTYDRAFHVMLDRSRELAGAGELDAAFNQFVDVQRACRACHALSRQQGLMAPSDVN